MCVNLVILASCARHHVDFPENLHSWHKFYTTAGRDGRDKSQLWYLHLWWSCLKGPFINLASCFHMLNFVIIRGVVSFILVTGVCLLRTYRTRHRLDLYQLWLQMFIICISSNQCEPCVQTNGGWPTFLHKRWKKLTIAWNRQFWSLRAIQSLAQSAKPLISVSSLKSGKIESVLVCNPAKSTTRRHSNPDCPFLRSRFAERLFVFPCGQCCYHFT